MQFFISPLFNLEFLEVLLGIVSKFLSCYNIEQI